MQISFKNVCLQEHAMVIYQKIKPDIFLILQSNQIWNKVSSSIVNINIKIFLTT